MIIHQQDENLKFNHHRPRVWQINFQNEPQVLIWMMQNQSSMSCMTLLDLIIHLNDADGFYFSDLMSKIRSVFSLNSGLVWSTRKMRGRQTIPQSLVWHLLVVLIVDSDSQKSALFTVTTSVSLGSVPLEQMRRYQIWLKKEKHLLIRIRSCQQVFSVEKTTHN
jgi:hypothetical protein